jgi:hypothetical protein
MNVLNSGHTSICGLDYVSLSQVGCVIGLNTEKQIIPLTAYAPPPPVVNQIPLKFQREINKINTQSRISHHNNMKYSRNYEFKKYYRG